MEKRLKNGINALFSAIILIILVLILFSFDNSTFAFKRVFLFSQLNNLFRYKYAVDLLYLLIIYIIGIFL